MDDVSRFMLGAHLRHCLPAAPLSVGQLPTTCRYRMYTTEDGSEVTGMMHTLTDVADLNHI